VEREVPPGDSAVSFHFACTSSEVVFDVTVAGGMVAIEAATSTFVPR